MMWGGDDVSFVRQGEADPMNELALSSLLPTWRVVLNEPVVPSGPAQI